MARKPKFFNPDMTREEAECFGLRWHKLRSRETYMYLCPGCVSKMIMAGFRPIALYRNQSDWCEMCDATTNVSSRQMLNNEVPLPYHMYFPATKSEWASYDSNPLAVLEEKFSDT